MKLKVLVLIVLLLGFFTSVSQSATSVVNQENFIELNSTALGISGVYTAPVSLTTGYSKMRIMVFANQTSATNGVVVQESSDADCDTAGSPNYDVETTFTYTLNTKVGTFIVDLVGRCARVQYTNGATANTIFRISSKLTVN